MAPFGFSEYPCVSLPLVRAARFGPRPAPAATPTTRTFMNRTDEATTERLFVTARPSPALKWAEPGPDVTRDLITIQ